MPRRLQVHVLACLLAVVGCQAPIAGTWKMAPDQPKGKVSFGAMTLAEDGTFTAEADYGTGVKVTSGYYCYCCDKLCFDSDGHQRKYDATLDGDVLTVTHDKTSIKMVRMPPKSCAGCADCCK